MDIRQRIGRKIALIRKVRGLTQDDLAHNLGKARQTVSTYETGTKTIPITELEDIAKFLEIPIGYFFVDTEADYELLNLFTKLSPTYRQWALKALQAIVQRQNNPPIQQLKVDIGENKAVLINIDSGIIEGVGSSEDIWLPEPKIMEDE